MKIYVNFDVLAICTKVLSDKLEEFNLKFTMSHMGEVDIVSPLSVAMKEELEESLAQIGISIVDDNQFKLVHTIKEVITEMIYNDQDAHRFNTSTYISGKMNYSYNYLSEIFSQTTLGSIESFVILKKIDYAKALICDGNLSFAEIAHKLNYSSSSHLSTQFKKTTGLTPTTFQQLILKRKMRRHNNIS